MYAHMLAFTSKENNTTLDATFESTNWNAIPAHIRVRFCFFLEQNVLRNHDLNLGRCKDM